MTSLTPTIEIDNNDPFFATLDSQEMIEAFRSDEYGVGTIVFGWVANEDSTTDGYGYPLIVTDHGERTRAGEPMDCYWVRLAFLEHDPLHSDR